jgi:hypothetical protein
MEFFCRRTLDCLLMCVLPIMYQPLSLADILVNGCLETAAVDWVRMRCMCSLSVTSVYILCAIFFDGGKAGAAMLQSE